MAEQRLERAARWTPLIILCYFATQYVIRIVASANLEVDEAQFVGQTHFALGYGNSHPPLYNWLISAALTITGGYWPAAVALVKNLLLAGTYMLAFDAMRRITGRALPGLLIAASFMLLPQIVWKSQITLAHTVLVMFAVVATLHALSCIAEQQTVKRYVWLGVAAGIGALAKYNFFLMLAAGLLAAYSIPYLRAKIFTSRMIYAGAIFSVLFGPHLIWAIQNLSQTTERMKKLERHSDFSAIDLPWLGIDGFIETVLATFAWAAPLFAVWLIVRYIYMRQPHTLTEPRSDQKHIEAFTQFFGRTAAIGLIAFAIIVLLGDLHAVHERYMTPMLMALPFWLILRWPLHIDARAPIHFVRISATVTILMVTAWPLWIAFGKEHLAYPYDAFAGVLDMASADSIDILAHRRHYAANIATRLEGSRIWEEGSDADQVVLLWDARSEQPPERLIHSLGGNYIPKGDVMTKTYPYTNFSSTTAGLKMQFYARKP